MLILSVSSSRSSGSWVSPSTDEHLVQLVVLLVAAANAASSTCVVLMFRRLAQQCRGSIIGIQDFEAYER